MDDSHHYVLTTNTFCFTPLFYMPGVFWLEFVLFRICMSCTLLIVPCNHSLSFSFLAFNELLHWHFGNFPKLPFRTPRRHHEICRQHCIFLRIGTATLETSGKAKTSDKLLLVSQDFLNSCTCGWHQESNNACH